MGQTIQIRRVGRITLLRPVALTIQTHRMVRTILLRQAVRTIRIRRAVPTTRTRQAVRVPLLPAAQIIRIRRVGRTIQGRIAHQGREQDNIRMKKMLLLCAHGAIAHGVGGDKSAYVDFRGLGRCRSVFGGTKCAILRPLTGLIAHNY
jgi:hypothetical protein